MATGTEARIFAALAGYLADLSLSPALPVAWPNVTFAPPSTNKWLLLNDFPAPTVVRSVDPGGANEYLGFIQVSVFWPLGQGIAGAKEVASSIIAHFKPKTFIDGDQITVEITQAHDGPVILDERAMIPITVRYRAFVPNPA